MQDFLSLMQWPLIAALVMSPVHCLFGLHIVRRGVIFIDLAVAQMAALGMAISVSRGNDVYSSNTYWFALSFALGAALLISLSRHKLNHVPHEAIIGIMFVLASALGIVVLEASPHGLEELKSMLTGSILLVQDKEVIQTAWIYGAIFVFAILLWRRTSAVTLESDDAPRGIWRTLVDFAFYGLLAFVVASSVKVAGVLVVFTWLVMPPVIAFFWVSKMTKGALIALPLSLLGSFGGLWMSFRYDWPTGPAIVIVFGVAVVLTYLIRLGVPLRAKEVMLANPLSSGGEGP